VRISCCLHLVDRIVSTVRVWWLWPRILDAMYLPSCDACLACGLGDYFGWVAVQLLLLECDAESSSASIALALEKDRKERTRRGRHWQHEAWEEVVDLHALRPPQAMCCAAKLGNSRLRHPMAPKRNVIQLRLYVSRCPPCADLPTSRQSHHVCAVVGQTTYAPRPPAGGK
jgi:hypothetical protein